MGRRFLFLTMILAGIALAGLVTRSSAQTEDEDMLRRGEYIAAISGCIICHTPFQAQYMDFANITPEDAQTLAFFEKTALEMDMLMAGGRPFDLGPGGLILAPNLTPDEETGLGEWANEEIKAAIQTGIGRDGRQLHPIMPFNVYKNMADADLDAVIAYLRSLEPIANEIPDPTMPLPNFGVTAPEEPIVAPDPSDALAYGEYLVRGVLPCQECHTPLDPEMGAPDFEMYLAGGQPYEGIWGVVYAANITPHEDTGIGNWTSEEIRRAIQTGVRPDNRRLVLMPWQDYAVLTEEDINAVLEFLRNGIEPVENEVPEPSLNEGFEQYIE